MQQMYENYYVQLLRTLLLNKARETRNGMTHAMFGYQFQLNELENNVFPILQGRKIFWKGVVGELAAFLKSHHLLLTFAVFVNLFALKQGLMAVFEYYSFPCCRTNLI